MKLFVVILLTLLFVQSYFFYGLSRKNSALNKEYEDSILAIQFHEKKNIKMIQQVQFTESKLENLDTTLSKQKIDYTKLKVKNDQLQHTINQLEHTNNSQAIIIQQKDNEILILKNELLKFLSE